MDTIISATLVSWREHCWVLSFSFLIKEKLRNLIRSWMANEKNQNMSSLIPISSMLVPRFIWSDSSSFTSFLRPLLLLPIFTSKTVLQHRNHVVVCTSVLALFCFMFRYTWLFFLDPFSQSLLYHMCSPQLLKLVTPKANCLLSPSLSYNTEQEPLDYLSSFPLLSS